MNTSSLCKIVFFSGLMLASSASFAAVASTTFAVNATVASQCSISATPLNFGTYDPLATLDNTASSTVTVTCSNLQSVTVNLDKGTTAGSTEGARLMALANKPPMSYGLYSDGAHAMNWGTGTAGVITIGAGLNSPVLLTVHGIIPKGQYSVGVGGYSDLITATVTY